MNPIQKLDEGELKTDIRFKLFNSLMLIIGSMGLVFMVVHMINSRPVVNVITSIVIAILGYTWYFLSKWKEKYQFSRLSFLILITYVYIPFGYWTSPGSYSAMMYLVIFSIFMLSFIAVRTWEYLFPFLVGIEGGILLRTEILFPEHYKRYADELYRINDLTLNFAVIVLAIMGTIYYVMKRYSSYNNSLYFASISDSLTGLYNRRFFNDFVSNEYNRALREDQHFTMVFLDLNNFKKVNDNYGHFEGDKVLKEIADIIKNNIRSYDIAARYGGDEFVIILPSTLKEEAENNVSRLESEFEKYSKQYEELNFSVAFGFEDSRYKSLDELYKIADELLYIKKQQQKASKGRNVE